MFSRLTGPKVWKLLVVSRDAVGGAFTGARAPFPLPLPEANGSSYFLPVFKLPNPEV